MPVIPVNGLDGNEIGIVFNTFISVKFVQPKKADDCKDVTVDGIVILVRFVQLAKAEPNIETKPEGSVTDVIPEQPANAPGAIDVTVLAIV